jgi:hypothetical protein
MFRPYCRRAVKSEDAEFRLLGSRMHQNLEIDTFQEIIVGRSIDHGGKASSKIRPSVHNIQGDTRRQLIHQRSRKGTQLVIPPERCNYRSTCLYDKRADVPPSSWRRLFASTWTRDVQSVLSRSAPEA